MATIKAFTSVEQSLKLAELLPPKSADMYWWSSGGRHYIEAMDDGDFNEKEGHIRAWSLAALYGILPNNKKESTTLSRGGWKIEPPEYIDNWWCEYEDDSHTKDFTVSADNPVDACVAMIELLHEQKLL